MCVFRVCATVPDYRLLDKAQKIANNSLTKKDNVKLFSAHKLLTQPFFWCLDFHHIFIIVLDEFQYARQYATLRILTLLIQFPLKENHYRKYHVQQCDKNSLVGSIS